MKTWLERGAWHAHGGGPEPIPGDSLPENLVAAGWVLGEPPPTREVRFYLVVQVHLGNVWMRLFRCFGASNVMPEYRDGRDEALYMDNYGASAHHNLAASGAGHVVAYAEPTPEAFAAGFEIVQGAYST